MACVTAGMDSLIANYLELAASLMGWRMAAPPWHRMYSLMQFELSFCMSKTSWLMKSCWCCADFMDVSPAAEAGGAAAQPASQQADPGMAPDAQPVNFSLPGQHERAGPHAADPQQAAGPLSNVFAGSTDDDPGPSHGA